MSLIKLDQQVREWAIDKGLDKASPRDQFLKVSEEVGEVSAALARKDDYELKDGIGDATVTLIVLALQKGWTLEECLQQAYNEIANRKGKLIDGVFIKQSDLEGMK